MEGIRVKDGSGILRRPGVRGKGKSRNQNLARFFLGKGMQLKRGQKYNGREGGPAIWRKEKLVFRVFSGVTCFYMTA